MAETISSSTEVKILEGDQSFTSKFAIFVIVCVIFMCIFVYSPWSRNVTFRVPRTRKVTIRNRSADELVITPRQCSEYYTKGETNLPPETRMYNLSFCKLYGNDPHRYPREFFPLYRYLCKTFETDSACYCIGEKDELVWDWRLLGFWGKFGWYFRFGRQVYSQVLNLDSERFYTIKASQMNEKSCNTIPFNERYHKIVSDNTIATTLFVHGLAIVYSEECKDIEYIPALYSQNDRLCIYGAGVGSKLKSSTSCAVVCDSAPTRDIWYDSN